MKRTIAEKNINFIITQHKEEHDKLRRQRLHLNEGLTEILIGFYLQMGFLQVFKRYIYILHKSNLKWWIIDNKSHNKDCTTLLRFTI